MAAEAPTREKMAGAAPLTVLITGLITVIISAEFYRQLGESNSFCLFGIALGFFNFANQAGLHNNPSLTKKHWPVQAQCFFITNNKHVTAKRIFSLPFR